MSRMYVSVAFSVLLMASAHASPMPSGTSQWNRSTTSPEVLPQLGPARSLSFHPSSSTLSNDPNATPDWVYTSDHPDAVSFSRPDGSTVRVDSSATKTDAAEGAARSSAEDGENPDLALFSGGGDRVLPTASGSSANTVTRITAGGSSSAETPRFRALPRAGGASAPEPSSLLLFGCALVGATRLKKRQSAVDADSEELTA